MARIITSCLSSGPSSALRQGLHNTAMRHLPRLEAEPESGAILEQLFLAEALSDNTQQNMSRFFRR